MLIDSINQSVHPSFGWEVKEHFNLLLMAINEQQVGIPKVASCLMLKTVDSRDALAKATKRY
jgi:hypothetical protein